MEFKRRNEPSKLLKKNHPPVVSMDDINKMILNSYLLDQNAHFIVTKEGDYDDSKSFQFSFHPEKIKKIEESYQAGHTIVIKDLEHWSEEIVSLGKSLDQAVNVHLYLSPAAGTAFDWHTDDRDVTIIMQMGEKTFEVEEIDGSIVQYTVQPGDELFIPYGAKHRALPGLVSSVHLSFGMWPKGLTIKSEYQHYPINISIKL